MLRFIFVLVFLGAFNYEICCGDTQTDDWRKKGFYRPRRNYPSKNDDNSFQASQNQYSLSQNSFRSNFGQSSTGSSYNAERQNPLGIYNGNSHARSNFGSYNQPQTSFGFANQNRKTESPRTSQQNLSFGAYQNAQSKNVFGSRNTLKAGNFQQTSPQSTFASDHNTFASSFNKNPSGFNSGHNSFTISQSQYTQKQNSFENSNSQGPQNTFRNSGQNSFGTYQNQNTFSLQNATTSRFSNFGSNSGFTKNQFFKAPDYLPPTRFMAPEYLPPDNAITTIPPYSTPKTTTRRPFYTTTTRKPFTSTTRPFFTTTTTRRNFFTTTTTRKPLTTTTQRPFFTTTTTRRNFFTSTTPKIQFYTKTTTKRPFYTTTTTIRPFYLPARATEVPPEPEDNSETDPDVMRTYQVSPAQATPVPPEPEDDNDEIIPATRTTTTTSTSSSTTTTTTTPSTTTSTIPPTTTTTTTPSTTTTSASPPTTTTTTPSTTTSTTPPTTSTTTTPSTTTYTTPPTTPSTTTSTTTTTTPNPNRNLIEEDLRTTTTPIVTTSTERIRTTTSTTLSTTITTPSTTTPSTTTSTTTTIKSPAIDPYKAPEYLPPNEKTPVNVPPSPALAFPVPPEPECDPLDPKGLVPLNIEIRNFGNPCEPEPTTTTIKPPFRGPLYLPPDPKVRVGRSSNNTLKLEDLEGLYRPVWYAGIYRKTTDPYLPICGGSIIREDIVISAAHCFWDDAVGKQPASLFAVAARKLYKPWKETMDKRAQKSDVLDIKIPPRFLGAKTSFQEDLAILKLATPFTYNKGLRPICVDFDDDFDRQQMKAGHLGTIAGWGYTDAAGTPTQRLLWLELPYVEIEKCIRDSEDSFLKYITCDKVCAGENDTGKALCRGDSGGGLAFWSGPPRHATPYLRGVASTAPSRRNAECNVFAYASFTHVRAHRTFLRDHVPDIETCRFWE